MAATTGTDAMPRRFAPMIAESWQRCVEQYQMEPDRIPCADPLTRQELRERLDFHEDLIAAALPEVEALFRALVDSDYIVSLAAADGLKLSLRCDQYFLGEMTRFGVLPGSSWREEAQGTNGVGTALRTGRAISVSGEQHFSTRNRVLSCHAVPVLGAGETIEAVLNATCTRHEDDARASLVLNLLRQSSARIAQLCFLHRNRGHRILRLARTGGSEQAEMSVRIALDEDNRILDATAGFADLLGPAPATPPMGQRFERLFDLPADWDAPEQISLLWTEERSAPVRMHHTIPRDAMPRKGRAGAPRAPKPRSRGGVRSAGQDTFVCQDSALMVDLQRVESLFISGTSVLLTGDSGTGKTSIARHLADLMAAQVISCQGDRGGRLDLEEGPAVLLLESVQDLGQDAQARLLALIGDERELARRGIFVVATSTDPFEVLSQPDRLRSDILYRIAGTTLHCPRLRDYGNLGRQIGASFDRIHGRSVEVTPEAAAILCNYHWPGNLRELNAAARAAQVLADGSEIRPEHLPRPLLHGHRPENITARSRAEAFRFEAALKYHGGNVTQTARYLGVSRSTLYRKISIHDARAGIPECAAS